MRARALLLAMAASAALACASAGTAAASTGYALGLNTNGELGFGVDSFELSQTSAASRLAGAGSVRKIVSGDGTALAFALALTESGTVLSWGRSSLLGRSTLSIAEATPGPVEGVSEAVDVAAGSEHGLALLADGHVEAWGANNAGQLGDGSKEDRGTAAEVPGVEHAVAVAAGGTTSLALLEDGTVEAWGAGQTTPAPVEGLSGVRALAAGSGFRLALLEDGEVRSWGSNTEGQLGTGSFSPATSATPVAVSGITTATAIAAGEDHALALLAGGAVEAWGRNSSGQLGNGTKTRSASPVSVEGLTATAVGAGGENSLAVEAGGVPVAWGQGLSGAHGPEGFDATHPRTLPCGLSGIEGVTSGRNTTYLWGAAQEACPFVSGLSPSEGPPSGGNEVTIQGSGFGAATAVHFGSGSVGFTVLSPSEIAVTAPAGSETEDVTVTTPAGTSVVSWADRYTWTAPPVIASITPVAGMPARGTKVRIKGTHLGNVTSVTFGGVSGILTQVQSAHEVTTNAPEGTPGTVELTVTNASGSASTQYTYEDPPEFGRCFVWGAGNGGDTGKGCQGEGGGQFSEFEWFPMLPSSPQRGFTMSSGAVKIQPTSGALLKCTSSSATGELTGKRSEAISSIALSGCKLGKTACQSEAAPAGTIRTSPLLTALGVNPGPQTSKGPQTGMLATPTSGTTLASFECGTQSAVLSGSFAAPIAKSNKMGAAIGWPASQKKGVPKLTQLEGLPAAALTLALGEGSPQPAGIAAKFSQALEEEVEVNTVK